jgi:thiol-disulfide isomerase/thioredoxin
MTKLLSFLIVFCPLYFHSQVTIKGISNHAYSKFEIGAKADYISNENIIFGEAISDSMGRFSFSVSLEKIEKLFIRHQNKFGFFYAQPKATYYVEFSDKAFSNFNQDNEIELTFINLDTLDINYKILTFEHWLDQSLNILYPLKEKNSGEFLREIKKFRSAVNEIYSQEKNNFFIDYVKYSLGMHIEELQDFAAPSDEDKFSFYLKDVSIKWNNDKYFGFTTNFYDKYFFKQTPERRLELMHLLDQGNVNGTLKILASDSLIGTQELAEVVSLLMVNDLYYDRVITKTNLLYFLNQFKQLKNESMAKKAADRLFYKLNVLDAGDKLPEYEFENINFKDFSSKPIYIQFFNPTNKKCLSELAAMRKLEKTYGKYIHFITIYKEQDNYTKADQTYLDQINWSKISVAPNHTIWKDLDVAGFPYYVYILPNLIIGNINALSPSPNGRYETIEKTLFEYKRMVEGDE